MHHKKVLLISRTTRLHDRMRELSHELDISILLATPDTFLTLRRAAAEEDADIDAALNSLLDGTLGWADGLEPGDEASAGSSDDPEDPEAPTPKDTTD